jgi:hypothetical protein
VFLPDFNNGRPVCGQIDKGGVWISVWLQKNHVREKELYNFKSINVCLKYNTIISICNIYTRKMKSPSVKRGD